MKKFLVVVDMQKDFVDGALGTKEAVAMLPAAASASVILPAAVYGWQRCTALPAVACCICCQTCCAWGCTEMKQRGNTCGGLPCWHLCYTATQ